MLCSSDNYSPMICVQISVLQTGSVSVESLLSWHDDALFNQTSDSDCQATCRSFYLIWWLASLRTRSTSLPFISSSLVRVSMVSLREWISWSRSVMRLLREHSSPCRSEMRTRSSCSWKVKPADRSCQTTTSGQIRVVRTEMFTVTCWRLCSIAFSSSLLAELFSLRWICFRCSMAVAWRWFSSARRDAARQT